VPHTAHSSRFDSPNIRCGIQTEVYLHFGGNFLCTSSKELIEYEKQDREKYPLRLTPERVYKKDFVKGKLILSVPKL
jgi:hypothetical protein